MLHATHMGSWYPTGSKLTSMLQKAYEDATVTQQPGRLRSIIVPHAGYAYCVQTSMHAFKAIDPTQFNRVFVLGPSHHLPISYCTIADANIAESPFGNIPIDTEVAKNLTTKYPSLFKKLDIKTAEIEHSMEMEFPLLKYIFKDIEFSIVPIMVGHISFDVCKSVAEALQEYAADPRTLFVISSDFCHWGARFGYQHLPDGDGRIYERIEQLDREATEMIATGDPGKFEAYLKRTKNTICGRFAITVMMNLYPEMRAEFPHYSQSSKVMSMRESSVSYMAGIIRTD
ncbi:Protein MEMO1 [Histomonas meleagridis]|uniref:Protein MEMO1 n=1 Tax=Histomonas meleagridis TaxID=135588 RepID=UPI00355981CB|nr:Protein MEMO1 [Histomonas meleagridis]KAH0801808.1 Protein MEMO1 [Histomonas meleagridis]